MHSTTPEPHILFHVLKAVKIHRRRRRRRLTQAHTSMSTRAPRWGLHAEAPFMPPTTETNIH
ncbi:hypothetical protein JYU34_002368 [Plutella xylostella]|uniref:Uncharacterized protein n=1 Tax=Plutella xylostella TaxID=51655 RepID=A0ABQ7R218_PLUXY|nr:hypothetical protein JYU34_002368 [Plutella xylostella]